MLTNNFKQLMRALLVEGPQSAALPISLRGFSGKTYQPLIRHLSGSGSMPYSAVSALNFFDSTYGSSPSFVLIGTDGTPVSRDDHSISKIQNYKITLSNSVELDNNGYPKTTKILVVLNTGTDTTVLRELGYGCFLYAREENTSSDGLNAFLIDRTLLDTPVAIAPGESAVVRYSITNQFDVD